MLTFCHRGTALFSQSTAACMSQATAQRRRRVCAVGLLASAGAMLHQQSLQVVRHLIPLYVEVMALAVHAALSRCSLCPQHRGAVCVRTCVHAVCTITGAVLTHVCSLALITHTLALAYVNDCN
jgi:hypothetical protein